jgi:hypothetical protein
MYIYGRSNGRATKSQPIHILYEPTLAASDRQSHHTEREEQTRENPTRP